MNEETVSDDVLGRAYPGLTMGAPDRKLGIRVVEATPERIVATYEVAITDEQDRRLCTAQVTSLIRPPRPGP